MDPRLPEMERLRAGLAAVFRGTAQVAVVDRKRNPNESTFPTEIVTCRLDASDSPLRLFIKYGTKEFDSVYGHRGDVSYEARVYRDVLQPLRTSAPAFYGVFRDTEEGVPWLVTEFVARGTRVSWSKAPNAMADSARWIAKFHAANEGRIAGPGLRFLRKYDEDYYRGWARRTADLFLRVGGDFGWLPPVCERLEELLPRLAKAPQTVIHGEYYPKNVIFQRGLNRPVDWQSAAIAAGEIDLAALIHFWPEEVARKCARSYSEARWPDGAPEGFEETLRVARGYMDLRWLGDPGWMSPLRTRHGRLVVPKKANPFIEDLASVAGDMDLKQARHRG